MKQEKKRRRSTYIGCTHKDKRERKGKVLRREKDVVVAAAVRHDEPMAQRGE